MMEIKTNRLVLRLYSMEDAPEIFACITPTLTRYMSWEPSKSLAEFEHIGQTWLAALANGTDYHFIVRLAHDNSFVGLTGLHAASTPHPELGIWVREELHGQGYGKEMVAALAAWATGKFNIDYFRYPVAKENIASRRIALRLGGTVIKEEAMPKFQAVIYHIPPVTP
jgi:RimJ/RimL family protein N-acetyltransferase